MDWRKIQAGQLRDAVRFEKNTPIQDGKGGERDDYDTFLTTRGYLAKASGRRSLEADEIVLNSEYELAVRYESALNNELNGGNSDLQIVVNNRFFTITSFDNPENGNIFFIFKLSEMQRG